MWYIKAEINYSTHPALTAAALGMALHWGMPGPECTQALPSGSPWPCTGGCGGPSAPRPCTQGVLHLVGKRHRWTQTFWSSEGPGQREQPRAGLAQWKW